MDNYDDHSESENEFLMNFVTQKDISKPQKQAQASQMSSKPKLKSLNLGLRHKGGTIRTIDA